MELHISGKRVSMEIHGVMFLKRDMICKFLVEVEMVLKMMW